jgi:hypothetical protein
VKRINIPLALVMFLLVAAFGARAQSPGAYSERSIYPSLAGSGDPWTALTRTRLQMMLAMHDGLDIEQLAAVFELSEQQVRDELNPLIESSLVHVQGDTFVPSVFVADFDEADRVHRSSKEIGSKLAAALIEDWAALESAFSKMSISGSSSLKQQGFMLVGSRILDIGVLGVLARDKSLLLPAPSRPSPTQPDGRYYFWIVEGDPVHLGKYGQDDTDLKWANWHVLNFGQTIIDEKVNEKRADFEERMEATVGSEDLTDPAAVAAALGIDFLTREDSDVWRGISEEMSVSLFKILKESQSEIEEIYRGLQASHDSEDSFGEFFCWCYHLIYAWAIDALDERGMIEISSDLYSGIVLYQEGPEGLLSR